MSNCPPRCTGRPGDEGPIYIALGVSGPADARFKHGWTHPRNLSSRSKDLARMQMQIVWHSDEDDDGKPWLWDDEQRIHQLLHEYTTPFVGREWYEVDRPLITVIKTHLLDHCQENPATRRLIARLARILMLTTGWEHTNGLNPNGDHGWGWDDPA